MLDVDHRRDPRHRILPKRREREKQNQKNNAMGWSGGEGVVEDEGAATDMYPEMQKPFGHPYYYPHGR